MTLIVPTSEMPEAVSVEPVAMFRTLFSPSRAMLPAWTFAPASTVIVFHLLMSPTTLCCSLDLKTTLKSVAV